MGRQRIDGKSEHKQPQKNSFHLRRLIINRPFVKIANKTSMDNTTTKGNHRGDNTHHHDQSIYPVSFSVIKTIAKRPVNPIPFVFIVLVSDIPTPYISNSFFSVGRFSPHIIRIIYHRIQIDHFGGDHRHK